MNPVKNILITILNWGLGHAARMIPIIDFLVKKEDVEVILASDGRALRLLEEEYPQLKTVELVSYDVIYSESESMFVSMSKQTPKFLSNISKEHNQIQKIIDELEITALISDNRYGTWSKKIPCIFITHQIFIQIPSHLKILNPIVHKLNHYFINKYDECWIPDFSGSNNLSGDLAHKKTLSEKKFKFIGPLSRLKPSTVNNSNKSDKILILLSGPEPHRSVLEKILTEQALKTDKQFVMVCGETNKPKSVQKIKNIEKISFATSKEIQNHFDNSNLVICRAGYSSIMDLVKTGKKAMLIPTEGQTEQEYLAKYLNNNNVYYMNNQNCINLKSDLEKTKQYTGLLIESLNDTFEKIITEFLANLKIKT